MGTFWLLVGALLLLLGLVALGTAGALRRRRQPAGAALSYALLALAVGGSLVAWRLLGV